MKNWIRKKLREIQRLIFWRKKQQKILRKGINSFQTFKIIYIMKCRILKINCSVKWIIDLLTKTKLLIIFLISSKPSKKLLRLLVRMFNIFWIIIKNLFKLLWNLNPIDFQLILFFFIFKVKFRKKIIFLYNFFYFLKTSNI